MKWVIFSIAWIWSLSISAMLPVHDPASLAQNAINFAKQLEEIERNAARITHEINAAKRMASKLKSLQYTDISSIIKQINSFRARARSIGYTYEGIANQFDRIYGQKGKSSTKLKDWQKQSDESIKDAMISQGLIEKSQKHMADLDKVLEEKRNSGGNADTLQALGEINAIQSRQIADLSQIIASDARARQSVTMEERAKTERQREIANRLMRDFDKHQKSRPLAYFPSLGSTAPRL